MMQLANIVHLPQGLPPAFASLPIHGVTADSRAVKPGYLFAALPGTEIDGAKFISQALERGAAAVITHKGWAGVVDTADLEKYPDAPVLGFSNPRRELALAAARYYREQPDIICAVTGTNGKTSIASFVRQIWAQLGVRAASMGTLGIQGPESYIPLRHTTPDPVGIHRALFGLSLANVNHLALEASSHGLAQYRLDGTKIHAAAFTNLTRDHLDYHEDFDDYLFAKMRLFGEVMEPGAVAVLNADADFFKEADALCWSRGIGVLPVGRDERSVLRLVHQIPTATGQILTFSYDGSEIEINLALVGDFQAMNALMAAALVMATGGKPDEVFEALTHLKGVSGRMQQAGETENGATIFVDYAHTPDALETVLQALRPHAQRRLHVVVGCGGDRDKGKRPLMGEIAARLADVAIITDDNPRGEDAATIRAEVLAGTSGTSNTVKEIGDRAEAIAAAVNELETGDILIVAGKGHETGQIVGHKTLPFNDMNEVSAALAALTTQETE